MSTLSENGSPNHSHLSRASFWLLVALFGVAVGALVPIAQWKAERRRTQTSHEAISKPSSPSNDKVTIKQWHFVPDISEKLAQFETVFWEPDDSSRLRGILGSEIPVAGKTVLEVGCGTGLISIDCLQKGAAAVVSTDVNPAAVANAKYNADRFRIEKKLECRLVPPEDLSAFSVVETSEQFDLIISNPPWEDAPVSEVAAYALYDPGFELLDSFLMEAARHLKPGGQLLLAYGGKTAIRRIAKEAPDCGWTVEFLDERELEDLPEVFVPAMLMRLTPTRKAPPVGGN